MREAQEVECFGRRVITLGSPFSCIAAKLDQSCFLGVQFQVKFGKPFLECSEATFCIDLLTEAENEVVWNAAYSFCA